ncbi:quercetin 2,3-dioxygenase [Aspergillus terreus NIH2624]|uniref:Quercetin 2,3-dioxygenase n=1 Tax=Aspergillus terreus (strain NIH 2624 / FGSC A1156) TaxID=341663 RepID=Q0CFQ6_ASPTN|nr:quercetin 2,3-dioxygenase [Aspergillus terreus NIH2624]EAU31740.1 quercetin 2,3-dioxygenase [Aspergillus terreus NIH2624]
MQRNVARKVMLLQAAHNVLGLRYLGTVYTGGSTSRTLSHSLNHVPPHTPTRAVTVGSQLYRFTITGPSCDNAFTLMNTNAGASGSLGALPHIHQAHYENFLNFKVIQYENETLIDDRSGQGLVLRPRQDLHLGREHTIRTASRQRLVYLRSPRQRDFQPRALRRLSGRALIHREQLRPKYLNSELGAYQIAQPLITPSQARDTNFKLSTVICAGRRTRPTWSDWDIRAARLEMGDVAFIPRREPYQHWTEASHAKVVYVSSGKEGAGQRLITGGKAELSHVSKV